MASIARFATGLLVVSFVLACLGQAVRGDEAADLETLREALARAEAAGAQDAELASLHARLGRALVLGGDTYEALQHLEAAAQLEDRAAYHLDYAAALLRLARENLASGSATSLEVLPYLLDAFEVASRVEDATPQGPRRHAIQAEARYWMGELDAAVRLWQGADLGLLDGPEALRQQDLLGHALYTLGRHAEAAAAFEAAGSARGAASAWAAAGRGPEALAAYRPLLAATPGDWSLLDDALRTARYTGVEEALAQMLATLDPGEAERGPLLWARGQLALELGASEAARALLDASAKADASGTRALVSLARLDLEAGGDDGRDAAVEHLLEARRRRPDDAAVEAMLWDLAGADYASAWRSPRALARSLQIQQRLAEEPGDDALAWANLGNTLRIASRLEEARAAYERALALDDADPAIHSDLGLVLSGLGLVDEALAAFTRAVEVDPSFEAGHQNAARLLWLRGEDAQAEAHLARALEEARRTGRGAERYRFLLDRCYRTRTRPKLR